MKERPILFSGHMVRAILDGRKTVTRRVVKLNQSGRVALGGKNWHRDDPDSILACPYGQPGDLLWVREAWRSLGIYPDNGTVGIGYGAGGSAYTDRDDWGKYITPHTSWKPSIHMPRWASRISLEVTGVRAQRLQDITEDEAIREGAKWHNFGRECAHFGSWRDVGDCKSEFHPQRNGWTMEHPAASAENCLPSARMAFANLINKINGPETWDSNPWVWAITFKKTGDKIA